jgi:putative ABC transport system permease protein
VVTGVAQSQNPITHVYISNGGFNWPGKDPGLQEEFTSMAISADLGKVIGWKIKDGRDFNPAYLSDSSGFIINEAAVKFMGLKHPVGETIEWIGNGKYKILGVVKDMINQSAYETIPPTFFYLPGQQILSNINIKINPQVSAHDALKKIGAIFKKYDPASPFDYKFIDDDYARKFDNEERIGKLASYFHQLPGPVWHGVICGRAAHQRNRCTKGIGCYRV